MLHKRYTEANKLDERFRENAYVEQFLFYISTFDKYSTYIYQIF